MSGIALAEKIGADQNRKVKEIQEGPLIGNKKEDNSGHGNKKENNGKLLVDSEIFR